MKPHIRRIQGVWYCFHNKAQARKRGSNAWWGWTPSQAYQRWLYFNTLQP